MSKRVPRRTYDGPQGTIYLLHFRRPFKHARHYLGFCGREELDARLDEHRNGRGSKLMAAVIDAGIRFTLARTWIGDRLTERSLKGRGGAARICPICKSKRSKT